MQEECSSRKGNEKEMILKGDEPKIDFHPFSKSL